MTPNVSFTEIESAIRSARSVLVASHLRPDADALGSTLAMTLWIQSLGIEVAAWNNDGMLNKFRYLPESDLVTVPQPGDRKFDLLVALDTSVQNRLGSVLDAAGEITDSINIDHHVSNERFGGMNYIDANAPATGEILADFFTAIGAEITPAMAANLFAAISTDTGSFQYQGTTPHTFEVAARLIRCGLDVGSFSRSMYEAVPKRRIELLRHALNAAEFSCGDRAVNFTLSLEDAKRMEVLPEDNEGIIDHLRAVDTVQVAVFFEELPEGKVRVSARSKNPKVDVCRICQQFGGGGHPMASGARLKGGLEESRAKFMKVVADELEFYA